MKWSQRIREGAPWVKRPGAGVLALLVKLCLVLPGLTLQASWLDPIDERLHWSSRNAAVRFDLSGLIDLEAYYIDGSPPDLLFEDDTFFFNPRLSLFLEGQFSRHFYAMLQARVDRGFDPGVDPDGDARLDEYLLRYTPFTDGRLNVQVGKFATVVGNWVPRHDSWHNPLINAPLPYENVVIISDFLAAPRPAGFLGRRDQADLKRNWLPVIWGPSYAAGASVFGRIQKFDYAVEVKNTSLSSRPYGWDPTIVSWDNPTVNGRLGYRPNATWNVGVSGGYGTYFLPPAEGTLPAQTSLGDFNQITAAADIAYAWRHWQLWGEVFLSRFEVPFVGDADSVSYYVEAKYKLTTQWFVAGRWNQQLFGEVRDAAGGRTAWDRDIWRAEAAIGYRHDRHLQTKLQYSYHQQEGSFEPSEHLVAAQATLKF